RSPRVRTSGANAIARPGSSNRKAVLMTDKPITFSGEHFTVAEIDPELLLQRKGSKKYLGFIPELCIVCGACVDQCPWHCLFMVDSRAVEGEDKQWLVDDAIKDEEPTVIVWV